VEKKRGKNVPLEGDPLDTCRTFTNQEGRAAFVHSHPAPRHHRALADDLKGDYKEEEMPENWGYTG